MICLKSYLVPKMSTDGLHIDRHFTNFYHFARVMFRHHIQHRCAVGRAPVLEILELAQVMSGAHIPQR